MCDQGQVFNLAVPQFLFFSMGLLEVYYKVKKFNPRVQTLSWWGFFLLLLCSSWTQCKKMCVLPCYVCTPCACRTWRDQERAFDPYELELQIVSCRMGAGNLAQFSGRATTAEPSLQPNVDILKTFSQLREFTVKRQLLSTMNSPLLHTCTHTHACQLGCVILSVKHVLHSKLFPAPLSDGLGCSFSHVTPSPPLEECLLPLEPRAVEWSGLSSSLICSPECVQSGSLGLSCAFSGVCTWVSHLPLGFVFLPLRWGHNKAGVVVQSSTLC